VLAAWLAHRFPQRLLTICAPTASEAERWLSDLRALTDAPVALYPQREGLGEAEPHYEIAGERVETLEALLSGRLRLLVTTARATAERTLVPSGLASLRVVLRAGERRPLKEVIEALAAMGYQRVPTVTEVAEFSVRGGIIDVYGFGMADAARAEWWGDELNSLWTFDLTNQRSQSQIDEVTILPISVPEPPRSQGAGPATPTLHRQTLLDLLPSDTLIIEEATGPDRDEVERAWREAEHHLEVARRLGEDVPRREDILEAPAEWRRRLGGLRRKPIVALS